VRGGEDWWGVSGWWTGGCGEVQVWAGFGGEVVDAEECCGGGVVADEEGARGEGEWVER